MGLSVWTGGNRYIGKKRAAAAAGERTGGRILMTETES